MGSGVGSADADVVQASGVAQGEAAGVVDAVAADPVVGVETFAGGGFGAGCVGGGRGSAAGVEQCGRWWLYSTTKASIWVCSSARLVARGWLISRRALEKLDEGAEAVLAEALEILDEDERLNRAASAHTAEIVLALCDRRPLRLLS